MRKISIFLVLLFAFIAQSADFQILKTLTDSKKPVDVDTVIIMNNASNAGDTLATTEAVTIGPFALTSTSGGPMYKAMTIIASEITGTTPTMQLYYQLGASSAIADTAAEWTLIDTLSATKGVFSVDLSAKAGRYIWFRIYNYDGTTCTIPDYIWACFKKNLSYEVRK